MANYNLVTTAQFKPMTYDEIIKPLQQQQDLHDKYADAYAEAEATAEVLRQTAEKEGGEWVNTYNTYMNTLEQQANDLATNGLSYSTRNDAMNLKRNYNRNIVPIMTAYTTRAAQAKEQQDARNKDHTTKFDRSAADTNLDEYIKNPNLMYNSITGTELAAKVGTAAKALSEEIRNDKNKDKWTQILGGDYYQRVLKHGFSSEEIQKAIDGDSDANPILVGLVNNTLESSGVTKWNNYEDIKGELFGDAASGLWGAIGKTEYKELENWRAKEELSNRLAMQREAAKAGTKAGTKKGSSDIYRTSYYFNNGTSATSKLVDKYITKDNKLGRNDITHMIFNKKDDRVIDKLFDTGKFMDPTLIPSMTDSTYADVWGNLRSANEGEFGNTTRASKQAYDEIKALLQNNGYSEDQISNMNREDVENALIGIRDQSDVTGRNLYRFALDKESSNYLRSKLHGRQYRGKEVTGLKDGHLVFDGNSVDFGDAVYNDTASDLLYDPIDNVFVLNQDGRYFSIPMDMIGNEDATRLQLYTSQAGEEQYEKAQEIVNSGIQIMQSGKVLNERQLQLYNAALDYINQRDNYMGTVGTKMLDYIGKRNTNTNS